MKFIIFFGIVFFPLTNAVLDGAKIEWDNDPYIVKVFARHPIEKGQNSTTIKVCTGTLISPSLVLTTTDCVKNSTNYENLTDIMVVYTKYGTTRPIRTLAKMMEQTDDWTLLKIESLEIDLICPKDDEKPKKIARLNIKPDLLKSGRIQIDFEIIQKSNCWLTGFETNGKSNEFFNQKNLFQILFDKFQQNPKIFNQFFHLVDNNVTACVDDIGNGIFCNFDDAKYQIGLLRNLMAFPSNITAAREIEDLEERTLAICAVTNKMVFTKIFDDDKLVESIQKHDFSGFVKAYEACKFL